MTTPVPIAVSNKKIWSTVQIKTTCYVNNAPNACYGKPPQPMTWSPSSQRIQVQNDVKQATNTNSSTARLPKPKWAMEAASAKANPNSCNPFRKKRGTCASKNLLCVFYTSTSRPRTTPFMSWLGILAPLSRLQSVLKTTS